MTQNQEYEKECLETMLRYCEQHGQPLSQEDLDCSVEDQLGKTQLTWLLNFVRLGTIWSDKQQPHERLTVRDMLTSWQRLANSVTAELNSVGETQYAITPVAGGADCEASVAG